MTGKENELICGRVWDLTLGKSDFRGRKFSLESQIVDLDSHTL